MEKHIIKSLVAIIVLIFATNLASAQDTIYKKDKSIMISKVYEVNTDDIKYKDWNNQDGPTFSMDKTEIDKIVFSNGRVMQITADPYSLSADVEVRDKTKAIKYEFFSPLTNDIAFGYEWMIRVGLNVEAKVGIIGVGIGEHNVDAHGAFVKVGPKFLLGSDFAQKGVSYSNGMRGRYFKPEIAISMYTSKQTEQTGGYYTYNYSTFPYTYTWVPVSTITQETKYASYSISLVYGRQVLLGKIMTLDWYVGAGFAFHTASLKSGSAILDYEYDTKPTYDYGSAYFGKSFPMVMSTGITLGYLFK